MKTILVTGASGFLGSRIVKILIARKYKVIGIDPRPSEVVDKNYQHINDVVSDESLSLIKYDISSIIHTASVLPYGNRKSDFVKNNVGSAQIIADFALKKDSFVVEVSSSSVYGKPLEIPVKPTTPTSPLDDYAFSKLKCETIFQEKLAIDKISIVRPRTILGADRGGIFNILFKLIKSNLPIPLPNSGNQEIQFVNVLDLARLCVYLAENNISGVWPAAAPKVLPLREHLLELSNSTGYKIRYIPMNPKLFNIVGKLLFKIKLTDFSPWHFGAFPFDNYFSTEWKPSDFEYEFDCAQTFRHTWESFYGSSDFAKSNKISFGKVLK